MTPLRSPLAGSVVVLPCTPGQAVRAGDVAAVIESMKMEHELPAPCDGRVLALHCAVGEVVQEGDLLLELVEEAPGAEASAVARTTASADPGAVRADLSGLRNRLYLTADEARPEAVARRHAEGRLTARENVAALCDPGSFTEYGGLAYAAQERRRPRDELIRQTPADGLVTGIGSVNGAVVPAARAATAVLAYDATVLAGTQGMRNHQKTDRLLGLALDRRLPVVLFAEGGGGRPGDVDMPIVAGLHVPTFAGFARLSGVVPTVAVVAGRCFAGNAALAACCDVIIATRHANLGMAGPAMIEGGGLGRFEPEAIGPGPEQARIGGVDVLVADDAQAVQVARRYLGYFQGRWPAGEAAPQDTLRQAVPENRLRAYAMRPVLDTVFDTGSVLELQANWGMAVITALARLAGQAVAVVASNPQHLAGAVDAESARKVEAFVRRADAFGLPIVSFIDTPGFMVGPAAEAQGQVRASGALFVAAARRRVPWLAVVTRRAYGLGAMALAGGSLHEPLATCAWPTGEFGAMGLEGAVRLGYRKELAAAPDAAAREALFQELLARQVDNGQAVHMAETLEIDAVIDPAETRAWLLRGLLAAGDFVRRD